MVEYIPQVPTPSQKCDDCGEEADVFLVAIFSERDNGYTDEVFLCVDCLEKREENRLEKREDEREIS